MFGESTVFLNFNSKLFRTSVSNFGTALCHSQTIELLCTFLFIHVLIVSTNFLLSQCTVVMLYLCRIVSVSVRLRIEYAHISSSSQQRDI